MSIREYASSWWTAMAVAAVLIGLGLGMMRATTDWHTFVSERVSARNAALVSGTWESLEVLTAPDSSARRSDEELWAWLQVDGTRVEAVNTEVVKADLIDPKGPILEVVTVQVGAHLSTNEHANDGVPMCRRWHLKGGLLAEIRPCPSAVDTDNP